MYIFSSSSTRKLRHREQIYALMSDTSGATGRSGKQLGNPVKLAAAVLNFVKSDDPPPQLMLGGDAPKQSRIGIARLPQAIEPGNLSPS
jgi:hypothetical protein